jgi:DNA-directed RNA polymerase subunit N (RpoN/RPB10)
MDPEALNAVDDILVAMPLRCFTCGTVIPTKKVVRYLFSVYTQQENPGEVLTDLSFVRPCCRRTVMSVPISEQAIQGLKECNPDEEGYNSLVAALFGKSGNKETPTLSLAEKSATRRVASRGRKAESVIPPTTTLSFPTTYPYNVYVTSKKGTSELVKGFRIYGPEDLEKVNAYEKERDIQAITGIKERATTKTSFDYDEF